MQNKYLFIDRDGTLIDEPEDQQVDSLTKFKLKPHVIPALLSLKQAGFKFVMVSNQDGLGTATFPAELFIPPQQLLMEILTSQNIIFEKVLICPHFEKDQCSCRKPQLGLVMDYLRNGQIDFNHSYVIGDRETDLILAKNMGIQGILFSEQAGWLQLANKLVQQPRIATVTRNTKETAVNITINLDQAQEINIQTGIGFFDHMLQQLAFHGGFSLNINVRGDLIIDEHHTVEDTALVLGEALKKALGSKLGIGRYGFLLPMDDAKAEIALDLCGRSYFVFAADFKREKVGDLPTELISHFFRSFSTALGAALHIKVSGENAHHMIEAIFKGVGRTLRQAIVKQDVCVSSTKGVL